MSKIYVVPRAGLKVPDPAVKGASKDVMLPPEGKWVEDDSYWRRRLRPSAPDRGDADVKVGNPPKESVAAKPADSTVDTKVDQPKAETKAVTKKTGKDGDA